MASAALNIAPVLTPQTLAVLADSLDRAEAPDKGALLRQLQPFIQDTVEKYFVPLVTPPVSKRTARFLDRFSRFAGDFEPFRLYLNFRIISILGVAEFVQAYQEVLGRHLDPLLQRASEMDMEPDLISAAVRDHVAIIAFLTHSMSTLGAQNVEMTADQLEKVVKWFRAATRFDYGLTAVFLILERSLPKPPDADKDALILACKRAVLSLVRATAKTIPHETLPRALRDPESSHIRVRAERDTNQLIEPVLIAQTPSRLAIESSSRESEMNWLANNRELSSRYGGQWIVVEKDRLVANNPDYKAAREVATRMGIKRPLIFFVPPKESGGFMGI